MLWPLSEGIGLRLKMRMMVRGGGEKEEREGRETRGHNTNLKKWNQMQKIRKRWAMKMLI